MGTPIVQWWKANRANRAAIRASVQPAQPVLVVIGIIITIGAFVWSFYAGDSGEVVRDLAVQGAVLAALAFVPGPWAERQAVIVCVAILVVVDVLLAFLAGFDKSTAGRISSSVLIVQALSPLWLKVGAGFIRQRRDLVKVTKATRAAPTPELKSKVRLEDL